MLIQEIKIRLLTIVGRFLLSFGEILWSIPTLWAFKLHQKIARTVIRWYHKYKHIHRMELWEYEDDYELEDLPADYILNLYQKDSRTKSGVRIVSSHQYNNLNRFQMCRIVTKISPSFPLHDDQCKYIIEVLKTNNK